MKEVVLKEVDSDVETRSYVKNRATKYTKNKKHPNAKSDSSTKNSVTESTKEKMDKSRFPRRRIHKKTKLEEENNPLNAEIQVNILDIKYIRFYETIILSIKDILYNIET